LSVTSSFTLPAQPATGSAIQVPLGGDGFSAPHSAVVLRSITLAHDVSGGSAVMEVILDDRFCSLVSYQQMFIDQATELAEVVRAEIVGATSPICRDNITLTPNATLSDTAGIWYPPSWILPGTANRCILRYTAVNVDGDTSHQNALIYQFDIRVRELTNVGFLNWARGPIG